LSRRGTPPLWEYLLMGRFLTIVFSFLLTLGFCLASLTASAVVDDRYCTVRSSSDSVDQFHSLRRKLQEGYNRPKERACVETIYFAEDESFNIVLTKTLPVENANDPDSDDDGSVFKLDGSQADNVVIDATGLGDDQCAFKINVLTDDGNVKFQGFTLKVKKMAKAFCIEDDGMDVDYSGVNIVAEDDGDEDHVGDEEDNCPEKKNPAQTDSDDDGVGDDCDNCPLDSNSDQLDEDEDGLGDACEPDQDDDGVPDDDDNCPEVDNPGQEDADHNGIGDACEESDQDSDGIPDALDNCPEIANPDQEDADDDGIGDACEPDQDDDGVLDDDDNCPEIANPDQEDTDDDGIGDACEEPEPTDQDNDGINDEDDNCPEDSNPDQLDEDDDGIGDVCDEDYVPPGDGDGDGDGYVDVTPPEDPDDQDSDGIPNSEDNCPTISNGEQGDEDGDGLGNECDPSPSVADSNSDAVSDSDTVELGSTSTCSLQPWAQGGGMLGMLIFTLPGFLAWRRRR
jgi:hypothetical protein